MNQSPPSDSTSYLQMLHLATHLYNQSIDNNDTKQQSGIWPGQQMISHLFFFRHLIHTQQYHCQEYVLGWVKKLLTDCYFLKEVKQQQGLLQGPATFYHHSSAMVHLCLVTCQCYSTEYSRKIIITPSNITLNYIELS